MDSNNSMDSEDHGLNKDLDMDMDDPSKNLDLVTKVHKEEIEDEDNDGFEGKKGKPMIPAAVVKDKELHNNEASVLSNAEPPRARTRSSKTVRVRVKKIRMTIAEVDAMCKSGLMEMRDNNMILKSGFWTSEKVMDLKYTRGKKALRDVA